LISSLQTSFTRKNSVSKIAIFTEGQTEQIFLERLLFEIVGRQGLVVHSKRAIGGSRFPRMTYDVSAPAPTRETRFLALIWDCSTDGRVTSDLRDRYQSLISSGYTTILAVRDVRPTFTLNDIPRMKAAFNGVLPKAPVAPQLILAALEVEAWFIADHSHFARIDPALTPSYVQRAIGIDLINQPVELVAEPATLLNDIYALVGATYTKSAADAARTVRALDFGLLLPQLPTRAPNFAPLQAALVDFFSPPSRSVFRQLARKVWGTRARLS
jgi:hypothetical protein